MIVAAVGMVREARIVARKGVRAVAGGGRSNLLEQRLLAVIEGAEAMLSIGIGGALDSSFEVGDVVIASEVLRVRGRWETDREFTDHLTRRLPGARVGPIYGSDEMVLGAMDKAKLRGRGGALLVDMEGHVAAQLAKARGLPFAALRVVSDKAGVSLPSAVKAGLHPDGSTNLIGVLAALAKNPGQLGALIQVGRDADRAFTALRIAADRVLSV